MLVASQLLAGAHVFRTEVNYFDVLSKVHFVKHYLEFN